MSNNKAIEDSSRRGSICDEDAEVTELNSASAAQVMKRNYTLNDSNALKKKLRNEDRKEPFNLGTEAKDGSNVVLKLKTSFFEYAKHNLLNDLSKNDAIEKIENELGSTASSNSGEAFVEYSMDIFFQCKEKSFAVKLTAYTTTCRLMFQPLRDKSKLNNKSIPRFFVDTYVIPWCEHAYANKTYKETDFIEAIQKEIKKLDLQKLEKGKSHKPRNKLHSISSSSEVKCMARGCRFGGINSSNKSAVGFCHHCGCYEHFECSKTSQEDREEILKGSKTYS